MAATVAAETGRPGLRTEGARRRPRVFAEGRFPAVRVLLQRTLPRRAIVCRNVCLCDVPWLRVGRSGRLSRGRASCDAAGGFVVEARALKRTRLLEIGYSLLVE